MKNAWRFSGEQILALFQAPMKHPKRFFIFTGGLAFLPIAVFFKRMLDLKKQTPAILAGVCYYSLKSLL